MKNQNVVEVKVVVEIVEVVVPQITGFAFSKVVNARLVQEKLMKVNKAGATVVRSIPPQMIYNYCEKKYIVRNAEGYITREVANKWLEKYITNLLTPKTEVVAE